MVDISHTPALRIMTMVQRRDVVTLLPIIQRYVRPGSTVWGDEWAAYTQVQQLPPVTHHQTVNQFVNPVTGVHTQNVESFWNHVKTKFKRMKGVQEKYVAITCR